MSLIERVEKTAAQGLVDSNTWKALPDLLKVARAASEEHLSRPCRDMRCSVCMSLVPLFGEDGTPAPPKDHFAEVTMYVAVCDGCGQRHADYDSEYVAWAGKDHALAAAEDSNWRMQDDDRLLCRDCRLKPGGDLFEDEEGQQ